MPTEVTDPNLLQQLNGIPQEVTDPNILSQLNAKPMVDAQGRPWKNDFVQEAGRQVGLAGRSIAQGVAGLPLMAMDAGVGMRNMAENFYHGIKPSLADFNPFGKGTSPQPTELPSDTFNRSLTQMGVPAPQNTGEKIAGIMGSALTGSRIPAPSAAEQAPAGFMNPKQLNSQVTADTIRRGQQAGYVVPPATGNRSVANMGLETIAGKTGVQQSASAANQAVTNTLAKQSIGLNPDAPLTAEGLAAVRKEAGEAYEAIQNVPGRFTTDATFKSQLAGLKGTYEDVAKDFPGLAKPEITQALDALKVDSFSPKSGLSALRILRDNSDAAYAEGNKGLAKALRGASGSVEDLIERNLTRQDARTQVQSVIDQGSLQGDNTAHQLLISALRNQAPQVLDNFRNARQTIAKTYTIEDAFNPGTGNVVAAKLAAALKNGAPLSGQLQDAAKFAAAFPKAVAEPTHSMGVNHLDMYAPLMTATFGHGMAEKAAGLAVPAARAGARHYLFSPWGQAGALPGVSPPNTGQFPMALVGAQQSGR